MLTQKRKDGELIRLVRQLGSKRESERQAAEDTLRQMGPDAVEGLLALVTRENRWRFGRVYLRVQAVLFSFLALWLFLLSHLMNYVEFAAVCGIVGAAGVGLFGSYVARRGQLSRLQRNALTALALYDDSRAIGPFVEALYYPDKKIQTMATATLVRLLPLLRDDHGASLTRQQRLCLYYCLKPPVPTIYPVRDRDLILAVLRAQVRTDDRTALFLVCSLAEAEAATCTDAEIRDAAVACDRFLHQRDQDSDQRASLLRASAAQEVSDHLLRPAQDSSETPAALLLRPTVSNGSEDEQT